MTRFTIPGVGTVDGFNSNFYQCVSSVRKCSRKPVKHVTCPDCTIFMPLYGDGLHMMSENSQGVYTCPKCKKIWERVNGNMIFTHKTFP